MLKKYFLFLLFQLKAVLKALPRLVICTIILAAIIFAAGYCGNLSLNKQDGFVSINVAIVMPDDDDRLMIGYNFLDNLDSLKEVCTFHEMDMDTAKRALAANDISVIIEIPEKFVDGIIYGDNIPATIITSENAGLETLLFCSVINAGCTTLSYTQAGIYSVGDLLSEYGHRDLIKDAEKDLNTFYIKYALNRGYFFNNTNASATGDVSSAGYYIASGIILLMLLCGLTVNRYFSCYPESVMQALKRCKINALYIKFTELLSVSTLFFALFGGIVLITGLTVGRNVFSFSFGGFAAFLIATFSIVSFLMFINSCTRNRLTVTLLTFILAALMLYMCGRIVPISYLPDGVASIGKLLPAMFWGKSFEAALFGGLRAEVFWAPLFMTAVFFGGSYFADKLYGREN